MSPFEAMKRSSLKARNLSLVPSAPQHEDPTNDGSNITDFFDGWVSSISPAVLASQEHDSNMARQFPGNAPLTAADVIRVSRSTVRESGDHRHWPPDVVRKFMVADVITRKNKH